MKPLHPSRIALALYLGFGLASTPLLAAVINGVEVSTTNPTNTSVRNQNGTTIVDIAEANAKGVSHNRYNQFNVGAKGLVMNNSATSAVSELAGIVAGNKNMAGGNASLIINEVTGNNRSMLKGQMEVLGATADVLLVNPYGITCDGCGFINTKTATLAAGKLALGADGTLESVDSSAAASNASLVIQSGGLKGSPAGLNLIAPVVRIEKNANGASITTTGDLNIYAGANKVSFDAATGKITGHTVAENTATTLDSQLFGGMNAGTIKIVNTAKNGTVHITDKLASIGQLSVNAANIKVEGGTLTGKSVDLSGDSINVVAKINRTAGTGSYTDSVTSSEINATDAVTLTSTGPINIVGSKVTGNSLDLKAGKDIKIAGAEYSEFSRKYENNKTTDTTLTRVASSLLTANGKANLTANNIAVDGSIILAGGDLTLTGLSSIVTNAMYAKATVEQTSTSGSLLKTTTKLTGTEYGFVKSGILSLTGAVNAYSLTPVRFVATDVVSKTGLNTQAGYRLEAAKKTNQVDYWTQTKSPLGILINSTSSGTSSSKEIAESSSYTQL